MDTVKTGILAASLSTICVYILPLKVVDQLSKSTGIEVGQTITFICKHLQPML